MLSPPGLNVILDDEVQLHALVGYLFPITHPEPFLRRGRLSTAAVTFARRSIWIEIVGGRPQDRERLSTLRDRGTRRCATLP
jgi:hypothetical protein